MSRDTRALTLRYIAVLVVVGAVSAAGQGLLNHRLVQQQEVATLVGTAGRQRMLIQRVVQLTLRQPDEAAALEDTLEEWRSGFYALQDRDPAAGLGGRNSPAVELLFQAAEAPFQAMLNAAIRGDVETVLRHEEPCLEAMEAIVARYQVEDLTRVSWIRRASYAALYFLLVLLAFTGRFIFAPAVEALDRTLEGRREAEDALVEVAGLERMRVGQVLHDELGSRLAGVSMLARAGSSGAAVADAVDRALRIIRELGRGMNPGADLAHGLDTGLAQLAERLRLLHGATIETNVEIGAEPPADTALDLYAIAQETLWNAVQHSRAERIALTCVWSGRSGSLIVEDDGVGFDPGEPPSRSMGLAIIRSRARRVGARLELFSRPGEGTRIRCSRRDGTEEA